MVQFSFLESRRLPARRPVEHPSILLIGPYDPMGGEYTFLAPPLGVWRLQGVLQAQGIRAEVFDPNCCEGRPEQVLAHIVRTGQWDVIGSSTTGMTLVHDLELAYVARRETSQAVLVAGGMEATFEPESIFGLGPYDLVVLGEGELPLLELMSRLSAGVALAGIPGTAWVCGDRVMRAPRPALTREQLRDAVFQTPYERMPYQLYWRNLERSYRVGELPVKADREARLAEIRSVRLNTLNYCPMGCTFCSSTNFLHEAQGGPRARIGRLDAAECLSMIGRIVSAHPTVRTIIFQDDIFVFTQDQRILPLCEGIRKAKQDGDLPPDLHFISTNRIDSMNPQRLQAMRRAGFRVLGFGVESFARNILVEFNKAQIHGKIGDVLSEALRLGITPFLDMILTSPRCRLEDLADNLRQAWRWITEGCEVGMYPYVIPFSGAVMSRDPALRPHTVRERRRVKGTGVQWDQAAKILPVDPAVRKAILEIEDIFQHRLAALSVTIPHLPSRVRSLLWIVSAIPVLEEAGYPMPESGQVAGYLVDRLPAAHGNGRDGLLEQLPIALPLSPGARG